MKDSLPLNHHYSSVCQPQKVHSISRQTAATLNGLAHKLLHIPVILLSFPLPLHSRLSGLYPDVHIESACDG